MKMNAKIKWLEDQKTVGESGTGHSVVMDALGSGKGVSPMEMLLLGVGGCTSIDVLRTRKNVDKRFMILKFMSKQIVKRRILGFFVNFMFITS